MEGSDNEKRLKSIRFSPEGYRERDAKRDKTKATALEALKGFVAVAIAEDPNFNISLKFLKEKMKVAPEKFIGIRSAEALSTLFSGINHLRTKLDLPQIKKAIDPDDY